MPISVTICDKEGAEMPKVYISKMERQRDRIVAYVYSELKIRGLKQQDLASYMGITQQSLSQKLRRKRLKFDDYVQIVNYFDADDYQLRRLAGIGE